MNLKNKLELFLHVKPYLVFFGTTAFWTSSGFKSGCYFCGDFPLEAALKSHKWNHAKSSSPALELRSGLCIPDPRLCKSNGCQGPRRMKIMLSSQQSEHAVLSLYAFKEVLFYKYLLAEEFWVCFWQASSLHVEMQKAVGWNKRA